MKRIRQGTVFRIGNPHLDDDRWTVLSDPGLYPQRLVVVPKLGGVLRLEAARLMSVAVLEALERRDSLVVVAELSTRDFSAMVRQVLDSEHTSGEVLAELRSQDSRERVR